MTDINVSVSPIVISVQPVDPLKIGPAGPKGDKGDQADVTAHESAADPHPQYTTTAEAASAAPVQSVNGLTGNVVLPEEVQQYANLAAFPADGEAGAIYIAQDTGKLYRWVSTGVYAELAPSPDEVQQYADLASFPATGEAAALYIAADTGLVYRWDGAAYAHVGLKPIENNTVLGNVSGSTAIPAALTKAQVREFVGRKTQTVVDPANTSTITVAEDTSTLFITGAAVSTVNVNFGNMADGAELAMWCQNGVGSVTLQGTGLTFEGGSSVGWAAGVTKIARRVGNTIVLRELLGSGLEQVYNVTAPNASVPVSGLQAFGSAAHIDYLLRPKGTGAVVAQLPNNADSGGNKRGLRATDLQRSRAAASQVASGDDSFIGAGTSNTASGARSCVLTGNASTASGTASLSGGDSVKTSGNYGFSWGTAITNAGLAAAAFGTDHSIGSAATVAFAAGTNHSLGGRGGTAFGVNGDDFGVHNCFLYAGENTAAESGWRQSLLWIAKLETTDATTTAITSNGNAISTTNVFPIASDTYLFVKAKVIARRRTTAEIKVWEATCLVANIAGTSSMTVKTITVVHEHASATTWTLDAVANDTSDMFYFQGTGEAGKTIQWIAEIELGPSFI